MKTCLVIVLLTLGILAAACGVTSERDESVNPTPSAVAPTTPTVPSSGATATPTRTPAVTPVATFTPTSVPTPRPTVAPATNAPTGTPVPSPAPFDELKFLASLPLPSDAEIVPVTEGIDIGYRTRQSEPAIIALYTGWITAQGWAKATELPYLQPNERWINGGFEFVVYITPKGAEGVAVINIQVRPQSAP